MARSGEKPAITKKIYTLNNGIRMPAVGLGTFRMRKDDVIMKVVDQALATGYRLFDTAAVYHNEVSLGRAFKKLLPKHKLKREDIFITSKIMVGNNDGRTVIERACNISVNSLGVDYMDMCLIRFHETPMQTASYINDMEYRNTTWNTLVNMYNEGRVHSIGVSNFNIDQLKELIKCNPSTIPVVNQVEWYPFCYQPELLRFCKENKIVLQTYSSFGGASVSNTLIKHPVVTKIAKKMNVTRAQVLLVWALHQNIAVIPKSTTLEHMRQNIKLHIKISKEDMQVLNELEPVDIKHP